MSIGKCLLVPAVCQGPGRQQSRLGNSSHSFASPPDIPTGFAPNLISTPGAAGDSLEENPT
jgi:hypothetical protein